MAQEFTINSSSIESKINQLLPSQGGFAPGVDFSASTMVIPIVDLTETAEGSSLREDLQLATDFASTRTEIVNATNTVIISTTGFFSVDIQVTGKSAAAELNIFDGTTSKIIKYYSFQSDALNLVDKAVVFLRAGDSLRGTSGGANVGINTITRQIADLQGNLTNPLGFTP